MKDQQDVGIWRINAGAPERLRRSTVSLEKDLEDWIEHDPVLLRSGLTIIGRQVRLDLGTMDLLALDPVGNWAVIEIKRGNVQDITITQALRYVTCISKLTLEEINAKVDSYLQSKGLTLKALLEERDIQEAPNEQNIIVFVIGTGRDPGLDDMAKFLSPLLEINVVSYQVFENGAGELLIVRQLTELDTEKISAPVGEAQSPAITKDSIFAQADANGIGKEYRVLYDAATKHGMYPRLYKRSIMYAPLANRTRYLVTAWVNPQKDGAMQLYVGPGNFAEFYPISEEDAVEILGPDGYRYIPPSEVEDFIGELDRLFEKIKSAEEND